MNAIAQPELEALLGRIATHIERGENSQAAQLAAEQRQQHPAAAELLRLHAIAQRQLGQLDEARASLDEALRLAPDSLEVVCNLASLELLQEQAEASIERLRAALRRSPGHPLILFTLGNSLMAEGRHGQARESFAMATHGAPTHPGLRLNLAAAELELGNPAQAITHIGEALQLAPQLDAAYALLGHAYRAQGKPAEAAGAQLQAERLAPTDPQHPYHAGEMLDEIGRLEDAAAAYQRALKLDPGSGPALSQYTFLQRRRVDWAELESLSAQLREAVAEGRAGITPFGFLAEPADAAEQLRCASQFASEIDARMAPLRRQLVLEHAAVAADAPIRAGFVSNGFGEHPTGLLTVALFEALKDTALEIQLYATAPSDGGPIAQRLQAATQWHDVAGLTPAQLAQRIHQDGIEILFDLRGYGGGSNAELFALRPAPIQVNWLAYPGSSGAAWMDYVLADAEVLPARLREGHSEHVVRLPRSFQPSDTTRQIDAAPSRQDCGLPEQGIVFAAFNNSYKLNPASFARFLTVLEQTPGSVLWLLTGPAGADQRLRERATAAGLDADRLIFMPRLPHADYLARYAHVDLFLDSAPYGAHTTASDALWAGCPLLTIAGENFASRVATSLLHHAGLPELVCEDEAGFVSMAVDLALHHEALQVLRQHLSLQRQQPGGLFDMDAFAVDFRRATEAMVARRRIGRPNADIDL